MGVIKIDFPGELIEGEIADFFEIEFTEKDREQFRIDLEAINEAEREAVRNCQCIILGDCVRVESV